MQNGVSMLDRLTDEIENGQFVPALNQLRKALTSLRAQASPADWRAFCLQTLCADGFSRHAVSRLLRSGPIGGFCTQMAANFTPELVDAAYLEAGLDWWPVYRSEREMAALACNIPEHDLRGQAVFREETGGSLFLDLQAV
jgi:hypothetical protein